MYRFRICPGTPAITEDEIIGRSIAEMIPDGATIQLGFGSLPNAVAAFLEGHKDLGIHTEVFCPGMSDLILKGGRHRKQKNPASQKTHFYLCFWRQRRCFVSYMTIPPWRVIRFPTRTTPSIIARNDNMISVNSVLEVDLFGQANGRIYGGTSIQRNGRAT